MNLHDVIVGYCVVLVGMIASGNTSATASWMLFGILGWAAILSWQAAGDDED